MFSCRGNGDDKEAMDDFKIGGINAVLLYQMIITLAIRKGGNGEGIIMTTLLIFINGDENLRSYVK